MPLMALPLAAAVAWGAVGEWRVRGARADLATYRAQVATAGQHAEAEQRAIETQRRQALQEITHVQALSRARDAAARRADGLAAAAAERRLRDRIAALGAAGAAGGDPAVASHCPAADTSFAELFGACTAEVRELAAAADDAIAATAGPGAECERAYDALSGARQPEADHGR
jgi:uncharacterized membrane protein YqiK